MKEVTYGFFIQINKNTEVNYTIIEKETLAMFWTKHFKYLLFGRKFTIYTDYEVWSFKTKGLIKLQKIIDALKKFKCVIWHRM